MDPREILRIVDAIHREKNIDKEIVFEGIEAAIISAARKHYGDIAEIVLKINRSTGRRWTPAKSPNALARRPPSR
jgi:N utilization substance protein A